MIVLDVVFFGFVVMVGMIRVRRLNVVMIDLSMVMNFFDFCDVCYLLSVMIVWLRIVFFVMFR